MKHKIIEGYIPSLAELVELSQKEKREELLQLANELREYYHQKVFETCMIMNARSGACGEDCKWCAQSVHSRNEVEQYDLVSIEQAYTEARQAEQYGLGRFSLVTSGRGLSDASLQKVEQIYQYLSNNTSVPLCGSMGLLTEPQLKRLYEVGMRRYHCNIETAPSFFKNLCTTHTIDEKIETLLAARRQGMTLCSGGIIGMGESLEQRIEMALTLREIGVDSIPVNILQPIKGTALENLAPLKEEEMLTAFAIFRIVNPKAHIRFAGGRAQILPFLAKALKAGVSASIVGDMLTTVGSSVKEDLVFFKEAGYDIEGRTF